MPISAPNPTKAINTWRTLLGSDHIHLDPTTRHTLSTATFNTNTPVSGLLEPADVTQLQKLVHIAHDHHIPIYPISSGCNWGYGSRVPTTTDAFIVTLHRLNNILHYDSQLGLVTIEPGVTFHQLQQFLTQQHGRFTLNHPGSSPHASIIGNIAERGKIIGPHADRWRSVIGLELLLPNGRFFHTGTPTNQPVYPHLPGPALDALFFQSNLALITKLTLTLTPQLPFQHRFSFRIPTADHLTPAIDRLQKLRLDGTLDSSCALFNDVRIMTLLQQYPWEDVGRVTPLPERWRTKFQEQLGGRWYGEATLSAPTEPIGRALWQHLQDQLAPFVTQLTPHPPPPADSTDPLHSVYWRKQTPPPPAPNPDRDHCGLIWFAPILPFTGRAIANAVTLAEQIITTHALEPSIGLQTLTPQAVCLTIPITYDRDQPQADETGRRCYEALTAAFAQHDYHPYRLDITSQQTTTLHPDPAVTLIQHLKQTLDPHDILAPGRYDFRHRWPPKTKNP